MAPRPEFMPAMKLHKASGHAYVNLNGQRVYLGKWETPEAQARYDRTMAEWLARGRTMPDQASALTVVELVAAYVEYAQEYYTNSDGTPSRSLDRLKRPVRDLRTLYGDTPAAEFGPLALRALRERWIDDGLSVKTITDYQGTVRAIFKFGVSYELVSPEVHTALATVPPLKEGRTRAKAARKVGPVDATDVDKTLPHLPGPLRALVRLQLLTGARSGELIDLRPRDVDRTDPECWSVTLLEHKTAHHGKQRILFLGPEAIEVLRPFLLRDTDAYCFSPIDANAERAAARKGKGRRPNQKPNPRKTARVVRDHYDKDTYNRAIRRACLKAGVERWHPHQLRHTRATHLRKILGVEAAQLVLGHSNLDTTLIYAERDMDRARALAKEHG